MRPHLILPALLAGSVVFGCESLPERSMTFHPITTWTFDSLQAPVIAAARTPEDIAIVPPSRDQLLILAAHGESRFMASPSISAVTSDAGGYIIGMGQVLARVMVATDSIAVLHRFANGVMIAAISSNADRVWVVCAQQNGHSSIVAFDKSQDGVVHRGEVTLPPNQMVVLAALPDGNALVSTANQPFISSVVAVDGRQRKLRGSESLHVLDSNVDTQWRLLATIQRDERRMVFWYADLLSLQRVAVVRDIVTGAVLSKKALRAPLGLIHALPEHPNLVLASHDTPTQRQLVLYSLTEGGQ